MLLIRDCIGKIKKAPMVKGFECQIREFIFYSGIPLKPLYNETIRPYFRKHSVIVTERIGGVMVWWRL